MGTWVYMKMNEADFKILGKDKKVFSHLLRGGIAVERGTFGDKVDRYFLTDAQSMVCNEVLVNPTPKDGLHGVSYNREVAPADPMTGFADFADYTDCFWAMKDRGDMDEEDLRPHITEHEPRPRTPALPEADEGWPGTPNLDTEP